MNVLLKLDITAAMFGAGTTIAYPDVSQGESLWVASATYAISVEKVYGPSIYECVKAHTGEATTPDEDRVNWKRKKPANRYAPFDFYISTKAVADGSLTYVMQPGFFTDVVLHGLQGDHVKITVKDEPGGTVIKELDEDLWEQARGLYELLFMPLGKRTSASLDDVDLSPTAELTVTVSSAPGVEVGIGYMGIGGWANVIGESTVGGTENGAEAEPKSYSYVKYYDDGTYEYLPRRGATNLAFTVALEAEHANNAFDILQQIRDQPVPVRATKLPRYGYLNTVGVVSARVRAENSAVTRIPFSVKGFI